MLQVFNKVLYESGLLHECYKEDAGVKFRWRKQRKSPKTLFWSWDWKEKESVMQKVKGSTFQTQRTASSDIGPKARKSWAYSRKWKIARVSKCHQWGGSWCGMRMEWSVDTTGVAPVGSGKEFGFYSKDSGKSLVCFKQRWDKAGIIKFTSLWNLWMLYE